ncbi:MAG: DUF6152 family protein [Steroidobacteraceae bacterium]
MNMKAVCYVLGLSLLALRADAHHSAAMFDHDKTLNLVGTVEKFEWTSPHVWLWVVVTGEDGQPVTWGLEANDIGGMSRIGWTKRTLAAGDKVKVALHPRLDGQPSGFLQAVTLPNGSVLSAGVSGARKFVDPNAAAAP